MTDTTGADDPSSDSSESGDSSDCAQSLLTPAGRRTLVKSLRSMSGGTEAKEASVYRDFA
ncbi:hypothetical protein ACIGJO_31970 [Streptomyces sp. NPDC079020]|uniref:hypothetical protein n=1 Tax=Streptomyces sp. NPDC079020 TaxID=3365722 RepID=UPI0037D50754